MNDLISRQAAIEALQKEIDKGTPPFDDTMGAIRAGVRLARNIIEDLPVAEQKRGKMTEKELQEVVAQTVKETVEELVRKGIMRDLKFAAYREVSSRLAELYKGAEDPEIEAAMDEIRADYYFQILPMFYGSGKKIEEIAAAMKVDASTVVRNKRRLCLDMFNRLV